ncbi:YheC/YheD family endospore coat-associated protein [Metabacillus arenae]|uniref:YheC/YheD family protein n=1 Tax=Metabacillus arenae TaxID=2771434 RepID=A0A926RZZ5_9BACI|nr:YheC/YheD family protein [Metabacillus arenae]MBD1383360.1 YheC/YheD family protein [Metabacillus arenae]
MTAEQPFPIIGILAGVSKKNKLFHGEAVSFKNLQKQIQLKGGLCFVFTMENMMNGFIYSFAKGQWAKVTVPIPHVVYNRVPTRDEEESEQFKEKLQILKKHSTIVNPSFFNKWTTHQILSLNPKIHPYLPNAAPLTDSECFFSMLDQFGSLYLKPVNESKGKGILKVTQKNNDYFIENKRQRSSSLTKEALWKKIESVTYNSSYMMQETISSDLIDSKKYDVRILAVNNGNKFSIAGMGLRVSNGHSIVTHVPNGGTIASIKKIEKKIRQIELQNLMNEVGNTLIENLGTLAEFSIDLGIDCDCSYFIYEVNSKPMVFDEGDIQAKRYKDLYNFFYKEAQKQTNLFNK